MHDRFGLVFLVTLSLSVSLFATEAAAASRQARERAARKACITGDPTKGVAILSDLFLDTKNPTYIYNQGRCYEQNSRFEEAISRFEEYLRVPEGTTSEKDKAEAEKHLADCRQKLERDRVAQISLQPSLEATPNSAPPTPAPSPIELPSSSPTVEVSSQMPPSEGGGHSRGLIIAGIVTGVLGAGGIAAGIVLNLKANQLARDVEKTSPYASSKEDDQKSQRTRSIVAYSAGAACAAAGAILVIIGASSGQSSSKTVALSPTLGSSHWGAALTGSF